MGAPCAPCPCPARPPVRRLRRPGPRRARAGLAGVQRPHTRPACCTPRRAPREGSRSPTPAAPGAAPTRVATRRGARQRRDRLLGRPGRRHGHLRHRRPARHGQRLGAGGDPGGARPGVGGARAGRRPPSARRSSSRSSTIRAAPVAGRMVLTRCDDEAVCRGDTRGQLWATGAGKATATVEVEGMTATLPVTVKDLRVDTRPKAVKKDYMEALDREVRAREAKEAAAAAKAAAKKCSAAAAPGAGAALLPGRVDDGLGRGHVDVARADLHEALEPGRGPCRAPARTRRRALAPPPSPSCRCSRAPRRRPGPSPPPSRRARRPGRPWRRATARCRPSRRRPAPRCRPRPVRTR